MNDMAPLAYSDAKIRSILQRVKTIAMVGASSNWNRPSYFVMKYLQSKGYRVIPVNPGTAGQTLLGETIYAKLADIPDKVDMVDVFRAADALPGIADDAIAIGAKVLWSQLGVRNDAAGAKAEAAGLEVIMDRCPKIEFSRFGGELSWSGVNSGIIRNRAPEPPNDRPGRNRPLPPQNLEYGFATRTVHAGAAPDPTTGARGTPIYQTTSFVFDDVDHAASLFNLHNFGHVYTRLSNPTVAVARPPAMSIAAPSSSSHVTATSITACPRSAAGTPGLTARATRSGR
jgi:O-acetylhomoserine (thiol)-lyase